MAVARMSVDRQLTFEILLYLNIFYYCLYAGMQALFLLIKYVYVQDMGNAVTNLTITHTSGKIQHSGKLANLGFFKAKNLQFWYKIS